MEHETLRVALDLDALEATLVAILYGNSRRCPTCSPGVPHSSGESVGLVPRELAALLRWLIGELGSQIEGDIALLEHIAGRLEAMAGRAP
jgi:hypothetical protein